jgi:hypothetical protein
VPDPTDPFADPELAQVVARKLISGADHPWELEQPPAFDPLEAAGRFMKLARETNAIVGADCEVEMWPAIRSATFHGEIVLPPSALTANGSAVVRASNFANLIAVLDDESAVRPGVLAQLRRRFDRNGYRFLPAAPLRRRYDGHHRGTGQFARWSDRLFGYL